MKPKRIPAATRLSKAQKQKLTIKYGSVCKGLYILTEKEVGK